MVKLQPTVVRGNASEILALAGAAGAAWAAAAAAAAVAMAVLAAVKRSDPLNTALAPLNRARMLQLLVQTPAMSQPAHDNATLQQQAGCVTQHWCIIEDAAQGPKAQAPVSNDTNTLRVSKNIMCLCAASNCSGNTKGVDSTASSHEALGAAQQLARTYQCIVAVSGASDLVGACCCSA
jgi:hypothetical protein